MILKEAVVLGTDVNGLGHIRSLGSQGVKVYGVYSTVNDESIGRYSKYCNSIFVEGGSGYEERLKDKIIALSSSMSRKPVLYETSDYYVDFISKYKDDLEKYCFINIPNKTVLNFITNKWLIYEKLKHTNIDVPSTYKVMSYDQLFGISESIKFPCIVKPFDSHSVDFPGKNFTAHTPECLRKFFQDNMKLLPFTIIQEIITGNENNIYQLTTYFDKQSNLLQYFIMQKIHQTPPGYGVTSYGRSVKRLEIVDDVVNFLKGINYTGYASVEFKWCSMQKKFFLIEINPRLPWYNSLFISGGINFPYLKYNDLTMSSTNVCINKDQINNRYWMYFRGELMAHIKRGKNARDTNYYSIIKSSIKSDSFAYWDKNDKLPFIMASINLLKWVFSKIFKPFKLYFSRL